MDLTFTELGQILLVSYQTVEEGVDDVRLRYAGGHGHDSCHVHVQLYHTPLCGLGEWEEENKAGHCIEHPLSGIPPKRVSGAPRY